MSASSLTRAAAATTISTPSTSIYPPFHSPAPLFHFKPKRLKIQNLKSHYNLSPATFPPSFVFRASAVFDSVGITDEEIHKIVEQVIGEIEYDDGVESQSVEARRLFVGNLHYSMTSSQLWGIFSGAGRVVSVEIVYNRDTNKSRGFAFITMASAQQAKKAIRLFDGSVNFPEVPKGGERRVMSAGITINYNYFLDSPHKLYAGNLSWSLVSGGLKEAFAGQPGFLSAKVIYDRNTGRPRGYGFISFGSAEELESALNAMNGVEIEGRPLRLACALKNPVVPPPEANDRSSDNDVENGKVLLSVST